MIRIIAKDKLYISFSYTKSFPDIVQVLKNNGCWYYPETKEWDIPISKYEDILEQLEDYDVIDKINPEDINKLLCPISQIKLNRFSFTPDELLSKPIIGKHPYENYQIEDLQRTLNRNRFAIYNDVGTGKSFIILSAINLLLKRNLANKILYVTSNSGVYDIKEQFLRFTNISEENITIGNKNNRRPFDLNKQVIICNYRSFLLISDEYQKDKDKKKKTKTLNYQSTPIPISQWLNNEIGICVLDESHNIAIHTSRQTKALSLIKEYFEYRYLLSGTPADKEEKYFTQLKFLDESLVKGFNYNDWINYYGNVGTRFSKFALDSFKPEKLVELQSIVKDICSRRLAPEVLVLPPNYEKTLYIELNPLQREIYEKVTKYYLKKLKQNNSFLSTQSVVNSFPTLIMSIDNPEQINKTNIDDVSLQNLISKFKFKDHSKLDALYDILDDHKNEKIVIWTSHPKVGEGLAELLNKYDPYILNGETKISYKEDKSEYKNMIVKEFQNSKTRNIFICGVQVLNSSITMTKASVQIYFDTNFNYTEIEQSEARIYRISQTKPVHTYRLVCRNSLDVVRYQNIKDKDFINTKFLSSEYINQDTLNSIFGGRI